MYRGGCLRFFWDATLAAETESLVSPKRDSTSAHREIEICCWQISDTVVLCSCGIACFKKIRCTSALDRLAVAWVQNASNCPHASKHEHAAPISKFMQTFQYFCHTPQYLWDPSYCFVVFAILNHFHGFFACLNLGKIKIQQGSLLLTFTFRSYPILYPQKSEDPWLNNNNKEHLTTSWPNDNVCFRTSDVQLVLLDGPLLPLQMVQAYASSNNLLQSRESRFRIT